MKKYMKTRLLGGLLFLATISAVLLYPGYQQTVNAKPLVINHQPPTTQTKPRETIEVVFVLDTTSSMGGLIEAAKEKIWSIASTMANAQPTPLIKMGLVGFRDRGDDYVTKVIDLSQDLDSMYASLMDFRAQGGGDGPESVNQALYEAVHKLSWSQDSNSYKVIFLVGDAPPHMDYKNDVKYPTTLLAAKQKGIVVNAIQCGDYQEATQPWKQIAQLGAGEFFKVAQNGSAVALATPFDQKIARISKELDATRFYYGDKEAKRKQAAKLAASEKLNKHSSLASLARRGVFNASEGGESNYLGDGELVDDLASGRADLSQIKKAQLPKALQALPQKELEEAVVEASQKRKELKQKIKLLANERKRYIKREVDKSGVGKDSLDNQIYSVIKSQASESGLKYDSDTPEY